MGPPSPECAPLSTSLCPLSVLFQLRVSRRDDEYYTVWVLVCVCVFVARGGGSGLGVSWWAALLGLWHEGRAGFL